MGCGGSKWYYPDAPKKDGTTLCEMTIDHIRDAHDIVGIQPDDFTPLVIVPDHVRGSICGCPTCWVLMPSGFTPMVTSFGKEVKGDGENGEFDAGCKCFPPWYRVNRLVSKQFIIFDTPVKGVKTKDHSTVKIDVIIVFSIKDAKKFVYSIGPEKLDDLLRASQEEILRELAYNKEVEAIYDLFGDESTKEYKDKMNDQFETDYGIVIHSFTVRNVSIPEQMAKDFESKTLYLSKTSEREKKRQMDLEKLGNEESLTELQEVNDNKKMAEDEKAITDRAQITKEVREVLAMSDKDLAVYNAETQARVLDITATAELDIAKIESEILQVKQAKAAEIEKGAEELEKRAIAWEIERAAQAKVEAKKIVTEGSLAIIRAEGEASSAFAAARQQEQDLLQLQVLRKLSQNPNMSIVTTLENNSGLAPDNSLVAQVAQQGMEAFRMKLAEMTSNSVAKLEMGKVVSGGLVRPVPQNMAA